MQVQASPYKVMANDFLASASSFCLVVFFLCATAFKYMVLSSLPDIQKKMSIVVPSVGRRCLFAHQTYLCPRGEPTKKHWERASDVVACADADKTLPRRTKGLALDAIDDTESIAVADS